MKINDQKLTDKLFMRLFVSSLLRIVVCAVCIVSVSFALFSDTLEDKTGTVQTATYDVTVTSDVAGMLRKNANGLYDCKADTEYTVTLLATGEATKGYAVVTLSPSEIYYSASLAPGETLSFRITRTENFTFGIRGHWGEYEGVTFANNESLS